jgi:quinohemoprotein ethanol dehydrogenase
VAARRHDGGERARREGRPGGGGKLKRTLLCAWLALACGQASEEGWPVHGRTPGEQRYSPLDQIDEHNVARLGLAWTYATGTTRGLEATPIVADGVLYATGSWSVVFALDARTGRELWRFDPQVSGEVGARACCDVVNRGVALYRGRVYLGALDGRLIALDQRTGAPLWQVQTTDPARPYTITGAPRVVKGRVVIGNGGADIGVRGYVSAYDAETGALAWRFYTVPGDPAQPPESPAIANALPTWQGGEWWKVGGGGTVWDSLAYDAELDLLYVGTGNGGPWTPRLRSRGDNLYLSSILALRPDTGELVWHYQTTPGDQWDYTATQHMILAELEIKGRARRVLLQAPKNGFFYVLDRATGELLSAAPYVPVTWAKRVDLASGRPVEAAGARYGSQQPAVLSPGPVGGHNWQPMSFHPGTGLVYIPALEMPFAFREDGEFALRPNLMNAGVDPRAGAMSMVSGGRIGAALIAWDPVRQREAWRVEHPHIVNGGTLATAGNLVFQGTGRGTLAAYRASDGKRLFEARTGTGVVAPPITYRVDGEQYVAVLAGLGGGLALASADPPPDTLATGNAGHVLAWKLGARAVLPEAVAPRSAPLPALDAPVDAARVARGEQSFFRYCASCHGPAAIGGGTLPDLRRSAPAVYEDLAGILLSGSRLARGMPRFDFMGAEDVADLRAYLLSRRAELAAQH